MNAPGDLVPRFEQARQLQADGRLREAEKAYKQLLVPGELREPVLRALAELYLQARRPQDAVNILAALTREVPDSLFYVARLATLLDSLGQPEAAISSYLRLLEVSPELAAAHFNLALLYKKNKQYAAAIESYERAIELGIEDAQEAWSNLGVVYSDLRQADRARQMYERALEMAPRYLPAMFNLAGLHEEAGDRDEAMALYRRIRAIDARHWDSLARIAYARKITDSNDPIVDELQSAVDETINEPLANEGLNFALGKVMDDLERYEEAFDAYNRANAIGKRRNRSYDAAQTEKAFDRLIDLFSADWLRGNAIESQASPIFICGMLRSGSTLVEQILAAHPEISAGGELDFLPWLIARRLAPYPDRIRSVTRQELEELRDEYLARLRGLFPDSDNITDKRPDNFVHLGLVFALFPKSRIVYTKRHARDNCLSIFFQQLGGNLAYATDLENTAHYYRQQERLMQHWQASFGERITTVEYEELVRTPEPVVRDLLEFLQVAWDERCLTFHEVDSLVKTASVWQVRDELHTRSSGRWRNYESFFTTGGSAPES